MAHTPGPWQMSGCRLRMDGEQWHVIGPDDTGWIAAVIYSDLTPELHRQSLADARLIAASPDMLKTLHRVKRLIDEALPKFDWGKSFLDNNAIELLNEVPGEVAAAITKAESGSLGDG